MEIGKKHKQSARKGAKKKSRTTATPQPSTNTDLSVDASTSVTQSEGDLTTQLWPGRFVALRLDKYKDEEPQLAKIESISSEMDVVVQWWTGAYYDVWTEWKIRSKVVTETVHKNAILKCGFELTRGNRLPRKTVDELKSLYCGIEYM